MISKSRAIVAASIFGVASLFAQNDGGSLDLTGKVIASDPETGVITLEHAGLENEALDAPLEPGRRAFAVARADAEIYEKGDVIRGTLRPFGGDFRLETIWPADQISTAIVKSHQRSLRQDTVIRGSQAYRATGEFLPEFALYNQFGDVITTTSLRGKALVINFIFTRCAMPNMCPAATQRMARLQEAVEAANLTKEVQLVTISFDPEFDTPGVLKAYADARGIDHGNYHFLTGPRQAIVDLIRQFGIVVYPENGTLNHTMSTLMTDDKGQILYRKDGSRWSVEGFVEQLRKLQL